MTDRVDVVGHCEATVENGTKDLDLTGDGHLATADIDRCKTAISSVADECRKLSLQIYLR